MIYEQLLQLFKNRRTVRWASETDIAQEQLDKILAAASASPSFDKLYPYKIHVLTNSLEGRLKKEQLLEYFRCGADRPFTTWENKEILQPVLSGVVLAYTWWPSISRVPDPLNPGKDGYGAFDATVSATMAMMAAESLGLKTSFLISPKERAQAALELTGNPNERLLLLVTISTEDLGLASKLKKKYIQYKGKMAWMSLKKHRAINAGPTIKKV